MKIEYIHDLTEGGKYKGIPSENLIRLFDFNKNETTKLRSEIHQKILVEKQKLDLSEVVFIESINCQLILAISAIDNGIQRTDNPKLFICQLSEDSYKDMIEIMDCVDDGYNWLCGTSIDNIDFLYSAGGTW